MKEIKNRYDIVFNQFKKTKIAKLLPSSFLLIILFIVALFFIFNSITNNKIILYNTDIEEPLEPVPVYLDKQQFQLNLKYIKEFDTFSIFFGTYKRVNDSKYQVRLYKNNKIIFKKNFVTKKLKDGVDKEFNIKKEKVNSNDIYIVEIIPLKVDASNAIAIFKNKETNEVKHAIKEVSANNTFLIIVLIISIIIFFILNYYFNTKNISITKAFLILSFGSIVIALITPPFQVPDEGYHFTHTYNLAQQNILEIITMKHSKKNTVIESKNFDCLSYGDVGYTNNVNNVNRIISCFSSKGINKVKVKEKYQVPSNNPAYIIPALVLKFFLLFTKSPLFLFMVGRLTNILLSLFIIYHAIKIIPFMKKNVLLIVSIPVFIQQMASYSYDSLLNSLCVFLVCFIIYLIYKKKEITLKDYIIYGIVMVLIMVIKIPYAILGFLILLVPINKYKKQKRYYKIGSTIITLFIIFIIYYLIKKNASTDFSLDGSTGGGMDQIKLIINNPIFGLIVAKNTIFTYLGFYLETMIGKFGYLIIKYNIFYIIAFYLVLISLLFTGENKLDKKKKIYILCLVIIIITGIFVALYISWTSYGLSIVEGVQGRYFLPLLLPIALVLQTKKEYIKINNSHIYSFITISYITYIMTLLVAFY